MIYISVTEVKKKQKGWVFANQFNQNITDILHFSKSVRILFDLWSSHRSCGGERKSSELAVDIWFG